MPEFYCLNSLSLVNLYSTATLWQDLRNLTPSKGSNRTGLLHRLLCRCSWLSDISGCLKAKETSVPEANLMYTWLISWHLCMSTVLSISSNVWTYTEPSLLHSSCQLLSRISSPVVILLCSMQLVKSVTQPARSEEYKHEQEIGKFRSVEYFW